MIKGQSVRLFYTAYNVGTGERVSGDAANHTFKWSASNAWTTISVTPTEISNGVYTFTLPSAYTDTDTAVILVTSSTEAVIIPTIELTFNDENSSLSDTTLTNIGEEVLTAPISSGVNLKSLLTSISTKIDSNTSMLTPVKTKLDGYPSGSRLLTIDNQTTAADIANLLLITDVSTLSNIGEYSIGSMILGGFCSTIDTETNQWRIKTPNGTLVAVRAITTSDDLKPVVQVQ